MFENLSPHGIIAAALIAPPGPDVLTALAGIVPDKLSDYGKVDLLIALDRQHAWLAALTQPALAAVGDAVEAEVRDGSDKTGLREIALRAAHAEISAALRVSDCRRR